MTTPEDNQALFSRAVAAHAAGQRDAAEALYRELLSRNPRVIPAHNNLGMLLDAAGKSEEAEQCFRAALSIRPDYPEALNNLGVALRRRHQYGEASQCFTQALALKPDNVETLVNLAGTRHDMGDADAAFALLSRALTLNPSEYRTLRELAQFYADCGKAEESLAALTKAASINPNAAEVRYSLFTQRQFACDWRSLDADERAILDDIRAGRPGISPFLALSIETTASDQLRCAQTFAAANSTKPPAPLARGPRASREKIRIGYASPDFHEHPTATLTVEMFERHDRARFEVFAYSYGHDDGSLMRARLRKAFDHFTDTSAFSNRQTAERIAADDIDILVDLAGHVRYARRGIFSLRPAPIQVNYLGYPGTLGTDDMDYVIADECVVPPEQHVFFKEKLVYLPDSYQVNSRREIDAHTPSRAHYGLPDDGFVFCCFNNIYKIRPGIFDIWMNLLRETPRSVLWLLGGNTLAETNLRREAEARSIAPDRLIFAPRVPLTEHLARHRLANMFLDTLPYNAHTTMSDALAAGLPAVTCLGSTFPGRVGGSILRAVGLPELVTNSLEEYEARALSLARHPDVLAQIRKKLGDNLLTTPLFDCTRFTRNLETAYARMWGLHQAGKAPELISIAALPGAA